MALTDGYKSDPLPLLFWRISWAIVVERSHNWHQRLNREKALRAQVLCADRKRFVAPREVVEKHAAVVLRNHLDDDSTRTVESDDDAVFFQPAHLHTGAYSEAIH